MGLERLIEEIAEAPAAGELADALDRGESVTAPPPARAAILAAVARRRPGWLVVAAGSREAERLHAEVRAWGSDAVLFPAWETLPHERLSPRAETVGRRLQALRRMRSEARPALVIAPVRAVMQRMVPGVESLAPVVVEKRMAIERDALVDELVRLEYRRTDMVERRGELAVRGGLVDVFPPTEDHPVRIEFFGDEVESVRRFAVASQRSLEEAGRVVLDACRELLPTPEVRSRAEAASRRYPPLAADLTRLAEGMTFEGMEALLEALFDETPVLRDLLPAETRVVVVEPKRVEDRAAEMVREVEELRAAAWEWSAAEGGQAPAAATFAPLGEALGGSPAALTSFRGLGPELAASTWEHVRGDVPALSREIRRLTAHGARVVVCGETPGAADRIAEVLTANELSLRRLDGGRLNAGAAAVAVAPIEEGFASDALGLAVVGEGDLFGKRRPHRESRAGRRRATRLDLQPGDLVVHVVHGVGRYLGMVTREAAGSVADYLVVEYADGDKLYVPTDQIDVLDRYIGGEAPKLHRLGGAEWPRQKARVRKAVREMADELIKLYSARMKFEGYPFSSDQPWQRELEDAFPYVETRDQLSAIDDVKADMERPRPMDRLICGDVGYGKTEIAIRAAFKAVLDGKQVAVLVPTTLLAQQHFATFAERFSPFPVRVAMLSRFISPREQKKILEDLAAGKIDVVIGTHRLLQKDVEYADLGLLVVDEEQRFGVTHKEAIKKLKTNVDCLTMTATPIPRTLEMSLSGIREMSVVDTPPEDRHPVLTYVGPFDMGSAVAAIRREMLREGQTFYVHNRVEDIDRVAAWVKRLVPEARVGVAHGQMDERALERVMLDFWDKAYDVLVTTTIIESGLDIPTVNTLVVDRADMLGLAQLYQLRGRVGRARERAYAYFFFPPEATLSESSHARLAAISQFTELGGGMQIALRDLEIRGAGNLLGAEQHGHIATVGFDLYVRLLAEAVEEAQGKAPEPRVDVKIDLPVDAHLPESWIPREKLRIDAYRRIADAGSFEQLADARAELADRYGPLPPQAEALLAIAELRMLVGRRGVRSVQALGRQVRLEPFPLSQSEQVRAQRLFKSSIFKPATFTLVVPMPPRAEDAATWLLGGMRELLEGG